MKNIVNDTTVSVIIPVRNAEKTISRCIEAIFSQSYDPCEVIVVDGHSTDRTNQILSKFPVKIIYEDYGTVGGARQVGLENAIGKYVAFTDADCMPESTWIENLVKNFTKDYVGIGGAITNIGQGTWEKSVALITNTFLGSANSVQGRVFKEKRIVNSISGSNSMYRKKDLLMIGGFNVALSINEETELNKRLTKEGKLLYTPNAMIIHNQERGFKEFAKRMFQFGHGRGRLRLWDLQCIPPFVALFSLLSLIFLPSLSLVLFGSYFFLLTILGFKISIKHRKAIYILSIPIAYLTEHFSYTIGFFSGLLVIRKSKNDKIAVGLGHNKLVRKD